MEFVQIDLRIHLDLVLKFRRDSFKVSFGDESGLDEEEYINWLAEYIKKFPDGFVLVKEDGKYIGQLELSIREYEGKRIGYVHLYYLIPEMRGRGLGENLTQYALKFFKENLVDEYHLRVSPTNKRAITFYRKSGLEEIGPELDGKVIRMRGSL